MLPFMASASSREEKFLALKARRSTAQGEGREAAEALGWND